MELDSFNKVQNHCSVHQCICYHSNIVRTATLCHSSNRSMSDSPRSKTASASSCTCWLLQFCNLHMSVHVIIIIIINEKINVAFSRRTARTLYVELVHLTGMCSLASNMTAHICMLVVLRPHLLQA